MIRGRAARMADSKRESRVGVCVCKGKNGSNLIRGMFDPFARGACPCPSPERAKKKKKKRKNIPNVILYYFQKFQSLFCFLFCFFAPARYFSQDQCSFFRCLHIPRL